MAHSRQLLAPVCALTLAVFSIAAAPITVSVEADDALPGDNVRYLAVNVRPNLDMLLIDGRHASTTRASA